MQVLISTNIKDLSPTCFVTTIPSSWRTKWQLKKLLLEGCYLSEQHSSNN